MSPGTVAGIAVGSAILGAAGCYFAFWLYMVRQFFGRNGSW